MCNLWNSTATECCILPISVFDSVITGDDLQQKMHLYDYVASLDVSRDYLVIRIYIVMKEWYMNTFFSKKKTFLWSKFPKFLKVYLRKYEWDFVNASKNVMQKDDTLKIWKIFFAIAASWSGRISRKFIFYEHMHFISSVLKEKKWELNSYFETFITDVEKKQFELFAGDIVYNKENSLENFYLSFAKDVSLYAHNIKEMCAAHLCATYYLANAHKCAFTIERDRTFLIDGIKKMKDEAMIA